MDMSREVLPVSVVFLLFDETGRAVPAEEEVDFLLGFRFVIV